jgi:predicted alpha/beta hydrolase family esterase
VTLQKEHREDALAPKRVVFVQGGGADVHDSWDNRLVASLERALGSGYAVRYPRMPKEADPDPRGWKKAIARELGRARDGATILVAHSVGAAILLDLLAEADGRRTISAVFLVAPPFIGDGGWPSDELRPTKKVAAEIRDRVPLYLYFGADDRTVPPSHGRLFERAFPHAHVRRLRGRDHQLNDDLSAVARDITRLESGRSLPSGKRA